MFLKSYLWRVSLQLTQVGLLLLRVDSCGNDALEVSFKKIILKTSVCLETILSLCFIKVIWRHLIKTWLKTSILFGSFWLFLSVCFIKVIWRRLIGMWLKTSSLIKSFWLSLCSATISQKSAPKVGTYSLLFIFGGLFQMCPVGS